MTQSGPKGQSDMRRIHPRRGPSIPMRSGGGGGENGGGEGDVYQVPGTSIGVVRRQLPWDA